MTLTAHIERVKTLAIIPVREAWQVTQAQREAALLVDALCFGAIEKCQIITAVTELANNLLVHASRGGIIAILQIKYNGETGLEIIADDDGPGIPDIGWAIQDENTTKGGLGSGLAGTKRLTDEFEIASTVGVGTRVFARKWLPCK